jgi:hypothetical protein
VGATGNLAAVKEGNGMRKFPVLIVEVMFGDYSGQGIAPAIGIEGPSLFVEGGC